MQTATRESLRRQLENRQTRLRLVVAENPSDGEVAELLERVDATLERIETRDYGRCLICHETVDETELVANPLLEYCLCDLTPKQQRALEHDLSLARRLQIGLLPDPDLRVAGWEAGYRYEPAGVVSGDYCDLWVHPEDPGSVFFAVADVSGKGVAASLLMAHIQASFRSLLKTGLPIVDLVDRVNQQLLDVNLPAHYATLACGRARADGSLEVINAGHCPPIVVRRDRVEALGATGLPVGVTLERPHDVRTLHLESGEALLLYTDGLTEACDANDEEYPTTRLEDVLRRSRGHGARRIVQDVRRDLTEFVRQSRLQDDLTIMALTRTGDTLTPGVVN